VYGGEFYGGEVYGGEVLGAPTNGAVIDSGFNGSEVYNGASIPSAAIPPGYGNSLPFGDAAPMLRSTSGSFGPPADGRPAFQVVGDRKLNPGELLPSLDDEGPTQSDKTAQAPKK
jgi:hypothetical protein